ncbi:UPF0426 protein At1g28150, chloroplastic isoform X2 [Lathyrus oleraceus]|uniref:Uncharacterized protein n=1 Tax=Pisum sativum TaxID=3888 RepID=A0A9D4W2K5_PEA|nr:UPF0426 protein At1g28150, chloroplastic isoform X2 [Pisum sativum]KAI5394859.1 hypothetical protein KIW84_061472 [Pisum sativum]
MSLLFTSSPLPRPCTHECRFLSPSSFSRGPITRSSNSLRVANRRRITAFFFNPAQDPIIKEVFKEPVAFLGGVFAGILRLDLNEEPLKEWVTRTVEASDISVEETNTEGSTTGSTTGSTAEAAPQEIEIE